MSAKPYVNAAFICETILTEKDNVHSAIRIVDQFFIHEGPKLSDEVAAGVNMNFLLTLKSEGPSDGEIAIKMRTPSGKIKELPRKYPIKIKGGEAGSALNIRLALGLKEYGLFWFDVLWNGEVLTSVPFNLISGPKPAEESQAAKN